jgi:hypothetical protein
MPSVAVRSRSALVPLLLVASALPLGAQAPVHGTAIDAAGQTDRDRAPLFFGSAYVAPKGHLGLSLAGSALTDRRMFGSGSDDQQLDLYQRGWGSTVSAAWGATSRLTLGAQLAVGRTDSEYRWLASPTGPGDEPSRRTLRAASWSPGDLRVEARYRLLETNATKLALNASLSWPNSEWGYGTVGLALARRAGRASLHLAPELRFRPGAAARVLEFPGEAPYRFPGRTPVTLDLRSGVAFAIAKRVSWTLEGMGTNVLGATTRDPRLFELGTGVRLDLGKTLLDLGYRRVVWSGNGADIVGRHQFVLGTHWKF